MGKRYTKCTGLCIEITKLLYRNGTVKEESNGIIVLKVIGMKKRRLNLIISYILVAIMMVTIVACDDAGTVNEKGKTDESTTGKIGADSTKTDRKDHVSAKEKKTTAKTEAKTEKLTEKNIEAKTEKKTETPTQAPTEQRAEVPTQQRTEAPTERKTEALTQAPTEKKTEAPTQQRTEAHTERKTVAPTQAPTEAPTEAPKCSHNWVWKTHTETVHHDAVTHEETYLIGDAWDEGVYVTKVRCFVCGTYYNDTPDYHANDNCGGSYGHEDVIDHYIHHDAEYGTYTVTDKEAYDEYVEVNDYQYCSKCGERN